MLNILFVVYILKKIKEEKTQEMENYVLSLNSLIFLCFFSSMYVFIIFFVHFPFQSFMVLTLGLHIIYTSVGFYCIDPPKKNIK